MEDISTAAIEVLVQNLINVFKEERALIRGLDQDADQLQSTLGIIKGYLKDAERKSIQEHSVKAWLSKLEAVAFDADNALDELTYHLLHNKIKKMYTPMEKLFQYNPDLLELEIAHCPKLTELPDGISTLKSLKDLKIYMCRNLKSIGNNSGGQSQLRELSIRWCEELIELPPQMVESWAPSLEILSFEDLSSLKNLPAVLDCLSKSATRLRELKIIGVPKFMATCGVESWPFGSLREIEIDVGKEEWSRENSDTTKETVDGMLQGCLNSLSKLKLKGMADWNSLPETIQYLTSMEKLHLENVGVEELPEWFGNLSSLEWLYLYSCDKLRRLPSREAFARLPQSKYLFMHINDCPELCVDSELRKIPRLDISVSGRKRNSSWWR